MQRADLNNPSERKKLLLAAVLAVVAMVFLWWALIGFGSSKKPVSRRAAEPGPPSVSVSGSGASQGRSQTAAINTSDLLDKLRPVAFPSAPPPVPESRRNIFAYYEKPPVAAQASTSTPTPTPTPPVLLTTLSPNSVYARTTDFNLEVTGNKFSPELRIYLDGRELPTRYVGPQQLAAVVPASLIAVAGQRQVFVRSVDGKLYSNAAELNVNPPPTPNYSYVGIIGDKHYVVDVALVQDRSTRALLNVQRGDLLSGRFRVTSISEKELVLTDTNLKIKHNLGMTAESDRGMGPIARPTPKVEAEDDEP